eukprot:gene27614-33348_t
MQLLHLGFVVALITLVSVICQDLRWTRLRGTTSFDRGFAVAVDSSGNSYITGIIFGTIDGETYVDNGVVYVTGNSWGDILGVSGVGQYDSILINNDYGAGVAVDSTNTVFITGYTSGALHGQTLIGQVDMFLSKLSSNGTRVWTKQFGSGASDYGMGVAVVYDAGPVYVTGYAMDSFNGQTNAGSWDIYRTYRDKLSLSEFTDYRCFRVPGSYRPDARRRLVDSWASKDILRCDRFAVKDTNGGLNGNADYSCQFKACPGERVVLSMLAKDGGSCKGDTVLHLMASSQQQPTILQTSYTDGSCPVLEYDFPSSSDATDACQMYTAVQGCQGSAACSGQTSIVFLA